MYIYIHILSHTHTHTNSLSHTLSFVLSRSLSHSHTHRHSIATKRRRKRSITQDLCKIFCPPVCYIRDVCEYTCLLHKRHTLRRDWEFQAGTLSEYETNLLIFFSSVFTAFPAWFKNHQHEQCWEATTRTYLKICGDIYAEYVLIKGLLDHQTLTLRGYITHTYAHYCILYYETLKRRGAP